MPTTTRRKIVTLPPIQPFAASSVSVANGGITAASFAPAAITSSAFAAGALAGQIIKRIQYITITYAAGEVTKTGTITAVDVAKTMLIHLGGVTNASSIGPAAQAYPPNMSGATLTNPTTVTISRAYGVAADGVNVAASVNCCVVEFQ